MLLNSTTLIFFPLSPNFGIITFSQEKTFLLVWEVTESLEMYDIPVVSLTSDMAKPNRRFYTICQQQQHLRMFLTRSSINSQRERTFSFIL